MRQALYENRTLLIVAIVLLLIALFITLVPEAQAQGGGRCYARYVRYWSPQHQRYITVKQWKCTGWQRPRHYQRRHYDR